MGGGARVSEIYYKESKFKRKTFFFLFLFRGRRGGGSRVSGFFYLACKCKNNKKHFFFLGGEGWRGVNFLGEGGWGRGGGVGVDRGARVSEFFLQRIQILKKKKKKKQNWGEEGGGG